MFNLGVSFRVEKKGEDRSRTICLPLFHLVVRVATKRYLFLPLHHHHHHYYYYYYYYYIITTYYVLRTSPGPAEEALI